ncbi:DUF4920 domain-containing protein [Flagellimonas allohymeniacidonis]|uniref:DUF4920 domain-containing protein n=1 Tax=Flagellimonas allohymeniacidonis TaxID=2517819 RepID=A0A4Q8QI09_9FLAO|nr:DUF4920 domain-containing protein [Allomuricauda hymeniacidonis]TAI49447.1 DUF4920 domain-containing protein [Allomuricauda hymeniacidonis]
MKVFNIFAIVLPMFFVVLGNAQKQSSTGFYGEEFKMNQGHDMASEVYGKMVLNDTIKTQLTGTIKEVCQVKGCWMKVELETNDEVFVKFKDYGFFVPTNSANKKVVLNGVAFLEEVSIEDQQHYAKDRGDSQEEIAKINTPKKTLRFEADGVLIRD